MTLHFGIPQIIMTVWLIIAGVNLWRKCYGKPYNTITSIISFVLMFAVLYWGGFYTN